jgi:multiple sugar transport system substrate-binding protein
MQVRVAILAIALVLAPLSARAADLVIWWEEGFYAEADQAVRETVAAFEQKTGKKVELVSPTQEELQTKILSAVAAGQPPDFLYGIPIGDYYARWAQEGRLVDLADTLGHLTAQFDEDALAAAMARHGTTGQRGLYLLPMGLYSGYLHVWTSLLERAGFRLEDIPKEWEPFWSFWCDKVQPAVRQATGREDLYGIGLPMSATGDTVFGFNQFVHAYEADYVTRDGRSVIDEPSIREGLVKVLDSYTAIYRKGCTPPTSVGWDNRSNNQAFLDQAVVLTLNNTLSIPNALKATRPEDYLKNAATIAWPSGAHGQPLAIRTSYAQAVVFRDGGHVAVAKEFVRFLVGEGWLAHWLDFTGDRIMPPIRALLEQPFWLDPGDPHRMAAAMQFLTQPRSAGFYEVLTGDWRYARVWEEKVWEKAVHRVAAEGVSPAQAADEAIARVKQILSE